MGYEARRILSTVTLDYADLKQMTLLDPNKTSATLARTIFVLQDPVMEVARWMVPLLIVTWIVISAFGRTIVLRKVDPSLRSRPFTLLALQTVRMAALGASFALWLLCLQWAVKVAVSEPIARGAEPSMVLYFALAIIVTLGMFSLWALVSWGFSIAPLLATLTGKGVGASLAASFRLGAVKMKLIEINLVMGIIKMAVIVLTMVFSASPLPFETIASAAFLRVWWALAIVLYLVASDFFHLAKLVGYLEMWRAVGTGDLH